MAEIIYRLPGKEQYSYAEVKLTDDELYGPDALDVQDLLAKALSELNAAFPNATGSPSVSGYQGQAAGPQAGSGHTCAHGERVYKSGTSAKGPWAGWMCPSKDRNNQCKPEWEGK